MNVRRRKNKSGSTSVLIYKKVEGRSVHVKTIGCATMRRDIEKLVKEGNSYIESLKGEMLPFLFDKDEAVEFAFEQLCNEDIRTVGPELIFGPIFDNIGFGAIPNELFRHLVIARVAYPLSKLKTCEYLERYQGVNISVNRVYRFLDELSDSLKPLVEQISFANTKKRLGGKIGVVFYDMTTLYFESPDESDMKKMGMSKDGKHNCPQIFIGLLVGLEGYAIGYEIFEGNISEGKTLIPFLERIRAKFNLGKPMVVADAGLLSKDNIKALKAAGYKYILGGRIRNLAGKMKEKILEKSYKEGEVKCFTQADGSRLIVSYSAKRARHDAYTRKKGLKRLEKRFATGKLTKDHVNKNGYNKYLQMEGESTVKIDYELFEKDAVWDGLKGYVTNSKLSAKAIIEQYGNLWYIERVFRMSKTDLAIRPIYHSLMNRIEAHICIVFTAYSIYKDLERVLTLEKFPLSVEKAAEITHNMYEVTFTLPETRRVASKRLRMDDAQERLFDIVKKHF